MRIGFPCPESLKMLGRPPRRQANSTGGNSGGSSALPPMMVQAPRRSPNNFVSTLYIMVCFGSRNPRSVNSPSTESAFPSGLVGSGELVGPKQNSTGLPAARKSRMALTWPLSSWWITLGIPFSLTTSSKVIRGRISRSQSANMRASLAATSVIRRCSDRSSTFNPFCSLTSASRSVVARSSSIWCSVSGSSMLFSRKRVRSSVVIRCVLYFWPVFFSRASRSSAS